MDPFVFVRLNDTHFNSSPMLIRVDQIFDINHDKRDGSSWLRVGYVDAKIHVRESLEEVKEAIVEAFKAQRS